MSRLRLAVIGPGLIGEKHVALIRAHPECALAAIVAVQVDNGMAGGAGAGERLEHQRAFFRAPVKKQMGGFRDLSGRKKDGTDVPVEIGLTPIHTAEGLHTMATIIDVSVRKANEAALLLLQNHLREEVEARAGLRAVGGAEHHRVAVPNSDGATSEARELAGLDGQRPATELGFEYLRHQFLLDVEEDGPDCGSVVTQPESGRGCRLRRPRGAASGGVRAGR